MADRLFLFAPGAGAPSTHPWMQHWTEHLQTLGDVRRFDYDYMRRGSRRPDPLPILIAAHRAALAEARESHSGPIVLIGKSMGGRIGCHVALQEKIAALICLGYPLCGGGDPTKLREITTPILFVQGTRDSLCPLDLLEKVRTEMRVPNRLHIVKDGDHSLGVRKKSGQNQEAADAETLRAISAFAHRWAV